MYALHINLFIVVFINKIWAYVACAKKMSYGTIYIIVLEKIILWSS
jgi:hypothetical protein